MIKKILFVTLLGIFISSCVTTGTPMPRWTEIKPANTESEIYFVYGPGDTRERAKEGLYKEISEYFGIKVSSFDKFVKVVEVENENRDINQSTESQIDIESREKGLNSIEVLEIWHDQLNDRWWFLASLDTKTEKEIKKQVEIDIENERVAGVLKQGEDYSKDAQAKLDKILDNITQLGRIKIEMGQSVEKVEGIAAPTDIMVVTREARDLGQTAEDLVKDSRALTNELAVINKKNELLTNQLEGNEVALIELDLFIRETGDIVIKAEDKDVDITDLELDISLLKEEADRLYLAAELKVLGDEEAEKKMLEDLITSIKDNNFALKKISDESKLILSQGEDSLRDLKQSVNSKSYTFEEIEKEVDKIIGELGVSLEKVQNNFKKAMQIKSSMKQDFDKARESSFITPEENKQLKNIMKRVDAPISWIEIYKDKVQIIINKAKRIKDDFRAENGGTNSDVT